MFSSILNKILKAGRRFGVLYIINVLQRTESIYNFNSRSGGQRDHDHDLNPVKIRHKKMAAKFSSIDFMFFGFPLRHQILYGMFEHLHKQ